MWAKSWVRNVPARNKYKPTCIPFNVNENACRQQYFKNQYNQKSEASKISGRGPKYLCIHFRHDQILRLLESGRSEELKLGKAVKSALVSLTRKIIFTVNKYKYRIKQTYDCNCLIRYRPIYMCINLRENVNRTIFLSSL